MVARTRPNVTLYVHYLPCSFLTQHPRSINAYQSVRILSHIRTYSCNVTHHWDRRMGGNIMLSRKLRENQHNIHDQTQTTSAHYYYGVMSRRVGTNVPQTRALSMNTLSNGTNQRFPTFFPRTKQISRDISRDIWYFSPYFNILFIWLLFIPRFLADLSLGNTGITL
jgi:hypothetical protein